MGALYQVGSIEVRVQERELHVRGERVPLGSRAFDLLLALIERRGRVATKAELIDAVWPDVVVEENNLAAQVVALRKALGPGAIATVPGRGYQLTLGFDEANATPAVGPEASGNLPASLDKLIARDAELEAVGAMLANGRLIQVIGPGGIGKTRLAQEVARGAINGQACDARWVDLAAISSPERIAVAIAAAVGARLPEGHGIEDVARALGARRVLLVLDNCEHLAADVAATVGALLSATPELRVLLTSQEVIHAPGSSVHRLGALAVPPPGASLHESRAFGAIRLLEQRAQGVDPRFSLSEATIGDAISLCTSLDGLPLALEMAAARLPILGPRALAEHIAGHLEVLRNARLDVPERQRTLRATLEWSYSHLTDEERRLLRHLSAFAGAFRLDAAQTVSVGLGRSEVDAVDTLAALVDKSLVQVESYEPPRYRLLDTTRRFAHEQLAARGEVDAAAGLHGRAMARVGQRAIREIWDSDSWLANYAPDMSDLQQASDAGLEKDDVDQFAATTAALCVLDFERDVETDARRRKEAALPLLPRARPLSFAYLHTVLAPFRLIMPAGVDGLELARGQARAWAALGDAMRHCNALGGLAYALAGGGRREEAIATIEQARALIEPHWPRRLREQLAQREAEIGMWCRDERRARAACEVLMKLADKNVAPRMGAHPQLVLARLSFVTGDDDPVQMLAEAVRVTRGLDRPRMLSLVLGTLGAALVKAGELEKARDTIAEAVDLQWRLRGTYALDSLALLASVTGRNEESARLLGFNDALLAEVGFTRQWPEAWSAETAHSHNERALAEGASGFRRDGARLTRPQAAALAAHVLGQRLAMAQTA